MSELRHHYKDAILALAKANKAGTLRVFGSVARGDTHYTSDHEYFTLSSERPWLVVARNIPEFIPAITHMFQGLSV